MKKIIRLTESDLARIVKRVINETQEVDEVFGFFKKRKKDGGDDYVEVKKFQGKNNVKLMQRKGLEPEVINGRVEFQFDNIKLQNGDENRIGDLKGIYHKGSNSLRTTTMRFDIDGDEKERLNNKYFDKE